MRRPATAGLAAVLTLAARPAAAQPVPVPSDPRASYEALEVKPRKDGLVEVLTRREGPSGTSYALREVDCRGDRFRYIGEGDTRAKAMGMRTEAMRRQNNQLAPLFEGSISWHVARFACRAAGR